MHVPVWHGLTKELVEKGDLVVVGITQEQHPDRCELFAQWKGLDFPILWDPFNLTGIDVVPVLTGIDEHGIVRLTRPNPRRFEEQFVGEFMTCEPWSGSPVPEQPAGFRMPTGDFRMAQMTDRQSEWPLVGLLGRRSNPTAIDRHVDALVAEAERSGDARSVFRAGVALRMRYDGVSPAPTDFQRSAEHWQRALAANPNQYIWRRRIQQWGPRLDKPYPFYDWVDKARAEIAAAGGTPVALRVPLSGAEVAGRSRAVPQGAEGEVEPDPTGKVTRDEGKLVRVETAAVLHTGAAGPKIRTPRGASRVHVVLRPQGNAGWTPDADPAELWLDLPEGWTSEAKRTRFPAPAGDDARSKAAPLGVDLEVSTPPVPLVPPQDGAPPPSSATLKGYVVYSVCEADGTCVFRRQDLEIVIQLPTPPGFGGDGDDDERGGDDDDR